VREAEARRIGAQMRLAARSPQQLASTNRGSAGALEKDAQRHVGRQTMASLVCVGAAHGACAVVGAKPRRLALERFQRRGCPIQIDEPQLRHDRVLPFVAMTPLSAAGRG